MIWKTPVRPARDADATGQAVSQAIMRFAPIKQLEQQDLRALHWAQERLVKARTALVAADRGRTSQAHPPAHGDVLAALCGVSRLGATGALRS